MKRFNSNEYIKYQSMIHKSLKGSILLIFIILGIIFLFEKKKESFVQDRIKLYVINLEKDKERYKRLVNDYKKSDFPLEMNRFNGIIGNDIEPEKYLTNNAFHELHEIEEKGYKIFHHSLTRGGVGCFLSHYSVMKQLLEENQSDCLYLILEDDTILHKDTYRNIQKMIKYAPEDWDFLLFYTINSKGESNNIFFNKVQYFWGMNCYIVNKKGAKKFIDKVEYSKIDGQVDMYLSKMTKEDGLNIYASKNRLVSSASHLTQTNVQTLLKKKDGVDPFYYNGFNERLQF